MHEHAHVDVTLYLLAADAADDHDDENQSLNQSISQSLFLT